MTKEKKHDLRERSGSGIVKTDTEKHVVGAESVKVPDDGPRLLTPDPDDVVPGQTTKG